MKKAVLAAVVGLAALCPVAAQTPPSQTAEKPFHAGGTIRLRLSAGDYRITGRPAEKIRVEWRSDRGEDPSRVHTEIDVAGASATVRTQGPKNNMHYDIDLPSRSDLDVDLSAGDLVVKAVEGSKIVESWAGDISIDVGQPELYRSVEASVRAGDLSAAPFNVSKGGLFRSFNWKGQGRYSLRVKLFAGDIRLR
jgi:hypothetical protein